MNKYPCELTNSDAKLMVETVNQGIDSRIRAVTNSEFEWMVHLPSETVSPNEYKQRVVKTPVLVAKLHCEISREDLLTIVLRLLDNDRHGKSAELANSIITSLDDNVDSVFIDSHDYIHYDYYRGDMKWEPTASMHFNEFWDFIWPIEVKERE